MKNFTSEDILQQIERLPPLPAAATRLLRLTNEPDVDFREIAKVISLDQALTVRLLRVANSAFYGLTQQIRTVQQALVVLGTYTVRNLTLGFSVFSLRQGMPENGPLTPTEFWRHSIAVACGARLIARRLRVADPEEAFVAGLLHDIGKVILSAIDATGYGWLIAESQAQMTPLHRLEEEAFGLDHAAAGLALCRHWNIPEALSDAVASHHHDGDVSPLVQVVRTADHVAKLAGLGDGGDVLVPRAWRPLLRSLNFPLDTLSEFLAVLPNEVSQAEQLFFDTKPSLGPTLSARTADARTVHLAVEDPDDALLLDLTLRGLQYEPVPHLTGLPVGAVTDGSLPAERRASYEERGLRILDFDRWPSRYLSPHHVNGRSLQAWLRQIILPPALSKAS